MSKLKPKKEKASTNEKFLGTVGKAQIGASQMFEAAHQAVLREAAGDQSGVIRGRAAGAVWQELGSDLGSERLTRGDASRQGQFENLAQTALGGALRQGTTQAQSLRDDLSLAGAKSRLSNAEISGRSARSEAERIAYEQSEKVKRANEWKDDLNSAAMTMGLAGYGEYSAGKRAGAAPAGWNEERLSKEGLFFRRGFRRGQGV